MKEIVHKKFCCGCTACQIQCPKQAIQMMKDKKGFQYPKIILNKCIDCGLCQKICPAIHTVPKKQPQKIIGLKMRDKSKILRSQSGGAFTAIAEYFLKNGAIIYGCALDHEHQAKYIRVTTLQELERLKGSKYVQASLDNTYNNVKQDLENGYTVLFSGTACYIAGVIKAVEKVKNKSKLYTVDIICHGTPSPHIYRDYLQHIEQKYKSKISYFDFRSRNLPWKLHKEYIKLQNGKEIYHDFYRSFFYSDLILRSSCGICKYASKERCSDFTIGDYWGVEKEFPEFDDSRGVSLLFFNTKRSETLLKELEEEIDYINLELEQCLQPNLEHPTCYSKIMSNVFWILYQKFGMSISYQKFFKVSEFVARIKKHFHHLFV